jgi:prevent-host-death family protein
VYFYVYKSRGENQVEIKLQNLISVSEMSRSASATIAKAQAGEVQIILNHNKPVAAIVDISVLERLRFLEEEDEWRELEAIAQKRIAEDNGVYHSLDDVAAMHGIKLPPRRQ